MSLTGFSRCHDTQSKTPRVGWLRLEGLGSKASVEENTNGKIAPGKVEVTCHAHPMPKKDALPSWLTPEHSTVVFLNPRSFVICLSELEREQPFGFGQEAAKHSSGSFWREIELWIYSPGQAQPNPS